MNRLKELRTKYSLSLRKLQEYTGIDFSRLAVIEKTNANVETKTVEKLEKFYKVSSTYLFGRDGFIYYFDETLNKYFSLPYEQYKTILTDDVITFSIVGGCIRRIISLEGYKRIDDYHEFLKNSLDIRLKTEEFLEALDKLENYDFKRQKERILEYFKEKENKEDIKQ